MTLKDCRDLDLVVGDIVVYPTQQGSQTAQMILAEVVELVPAAEKYPYTPARVRVRRFFNSHGYSVNTEKTALVRAAYTMKVDLPSKPGLTFFG